MATAVVEELEKEYDDLESEAASERIGEIETIGYDINFYCLDLTNTAWVRAWTNDKNTCLLMCQAEDREFDTLAKVFRAMTLSLLADGKVRPAN
jgi:hypothetical protein